MAIKNRVEESYARFDAKGKRLYRGGKIRDRLVENEDARRRKMLEQNDAEFRRREFGEGEQESLIKKIGRFLRLIK